jgi:hypothetical protein
MVRKMARWSILSDLLVQVTKQKIAGPMILFLANVLELLDA